VERNSLSPAGELSEIITRFVRGQPFMEFWRAFMDFHANHSDLPGLSAPEQVEYERIYELVYMGQPDPVAPDDFAVGLRGEAELREQLRRSPFTHL
jgi:hypothetical protein